MGTSEFLHSEDRIAQVRKMKKKFAPCMPYRAAFEKTGQEIGNGITPSVLHRSGI